MRTNEDRNWEHIGNMLAQESSGKSPRMFSSRRTLFGIPSALDQELEALASQNTAEKGVNRGEVGKSKNIEEKKNKKKDTKRVRDKEACKVSHVKHPLEPVYDENSQVLILGTMPSPKSRETGFYYNHPQNRFWKVMAALFDVEVPSTNEDKKQLVLDHGIALWDVLAECTIEGASDGSIAECVPNNIGKILAKAPIKAIFCTGVKAFDLYCKYCEPSTGMSATRLPSTSPANAATSLVQLIEAYRVIVPYCR